MSFPSISPKQSFPALESEVLAYWKANNTFQKSIDSRPEDNPYRFYDGPPFITGTPHYGSLLSSIVKDVVGRYWTMRGKRVDRVWGWDCHGLPIEEKVMKKLNLGSNKEIEERGVKEFIDGCYEYTQSTSAEWDWYIDKIGRWVDMDRAYRTMDQDYMESVMWAFSQLWDKGLIYEGKRVSLYSWKLGTPISNFEVAMDDTYQEVNDPAITVKFELEKNDKFPEGTKVLAWTTTPWTIPANMALAVRNDIDYVLVELSPLLKEGADGKEAGDFQKTENPQSSASLQTAPFRKELSEQFIVAKNRAESVFKGKGEYTIIREFKGSEFVGLGYIPPFPEYYYKSPLLKEGADGKEAGDFQKTENPQSATEQADSSFQKGASIKNHKIYHADFITDTDGTGIGHEAPEFGDVDFQLAKKEGIFISEAMDEAGKYTSQIHDYEGLHYQEANKVNIERMKENDTLFKLEGITHRVPFCPRSNTPLVQKAQKSWFIDIASQKEKLLKANEQINWFPEHLKFGRFAKGIESAPDWCISRTRYWGAPMPVWQNKDGSERVVVSSREEIFERNKPYGQLTKLIITRHAESVANVEKHYDDIGLSPLSQKGFEQAEELAQELKDAGVDVIVTSPFLRAMQTAEPLAKALGIEIITDVRLKESDHGNLANASYLDSEMLNIVHNERKKMFQDRDYKFAEIGESYQDIEARIKGVIDDICAKYPGKTVFLVSHGIPTDIINRYLTSKKSSKKSRNAETSTFILDVTNKNLLNLHKPYIDSILLAPQKSEKPKKVLGIHGFCRTDTVVDFLEGTRKNLEKQGIQMDAPLFEKGNSVHYENWEKKFDKLNLSNYDTILTHSLGSRAVMNYIIEKRVELNRLVMVAPGMDSTTKEVQDFYDSLSADVTELKKYVKEVIVIASLNDKGREGKAKILAELVGARYIEVDGYGHFNLHECKLIEGLVLNGEPLVRISEVLDVWMDSGSMPYAQMHYPFENKGEMEASFPADFIAEYVGQVRAWFYVMHVLGVLLMSKEDTDTHTNTEENTIVPGTKSNSDVSVPSVTVTPAFTNVITTGVINGNDGRKMSKSYGNFPDPRITIEKYGADPIRFYMLNSPLLSGGDMDFKEEQIIETVKGVMLPIWNTYSFFTTYANIDNWNPDDTEVWFTRHGETTSNVATTMSDGTDNPELTEKGREQSKIASKILKDEGKKFDIIIHTSKVRAHDTAHIIGDGIGFTGEYVVDDSFIEQAAGEYARMTHDAMRSAFAKENNINPAEVTDAQIRTLYKNNSLENLEKFEKRILLGYENILNKYRGKKVLIVAHAGTSRPILNHYFGKGLESAHYETKIGNAEPFRLMTTPLVNELDRWILSKLQVLLGQVHDAMDGYDVSRACRAIVDYMDHLTNWYVRLSRRRFWESGMTADKKSAYSTLHTVLVELSKLLAPYMPFLSEAVYKGLTDQKTDTHTDTQRNISDNNTETNVSSVTVPVSDNSVHLQYVTFPNRHLIANDLNRDMEKCENIVSLGLALRSQKNIRVRQPLQSVTITAELDIYYQNIIKDELNVKEIKLENPEKLAKKIAKPDAKKIGPKYGKEVQSIIIAAKNGEFKELEEGKLQVGNFILESGEYVLEYLPLEGVGDVVGGYGMVVAMDTAISEDLKLEGYARDIIRLIQDMRKDVNYNVTDRISLSIIGEESDMIRSRFGDMITSETLSTLVDQIDTPDTMREEAIDEDNVVQIAIKR